MEIDRRSFLLTAAAAAAEAGARYTNKLVPYVNPPEDTTPGTWTLYATTCRECPAGCGMHAWHRDGRVTKVEGNPSHPVNHGALCARGQASLQGLYDPDRVRRPLRRERGGGETAVSPDKAYAEVARLITERKGALHVVGGLETGALAEVVEAFAKAFGGDVAWYEAFDYSALRDAHEAVFGEAAVPRYGIGECDYILSLSCDFLETWVSPIEFAYGFGQMHAYRDGDVGRMTYVGPRLSMTAANADEYVQVPPGGEVAVAAGVLKSLVDHDLAANAGAARESLAAWGADGPRLPEGVSQAQVDRIARAFAGAGKSVALAGPVAAGPAAKDLAAAAALLNAAAGRVGQTVDFSRPHALGRVARASDVRTTLEGLAGDDVVVFYNTNPAFTLPGVAEALHRAGAVVSICSAMDETAAHADWVLPVATPLESWGDYEPYEGIYGLMQPTMSPLYHAPQAGDVFLAVARAAGRPLARGALPMETFRDWLADRWNAEVVPAEPSATWPDILARGWVETRPSPPRPATPPAKAYRLAPPAAEETLPAGKALLWAWPSIMLFDGRTANRGWLQEAPHPMSYIAWSSWVDVHPLKALALGLRQNDVVEISGPHGRFEAPVRVTEEVSAGTVAVAFGEGHTAYGRYAAGYGDNAFEVIGGEGGMFGVVEIRRTGRSEMPTYTSPTQQQYHRDIIQWTPLSKARGMKWGEGDDLILPLPEGYRKDRDLYPPRIYTEHRWAMVVDLQKCIGCGACAVACYAENNIPVMGKVQVGNGREMAWLKVAPYRHQEDNMRVGWLPLVCQHCDAAPCEPVCPVFAAVHNEEGLNAQIFNRCIGTRYCSNNCPYKVRRFNWFDPVWAEPLEMQLNPEVTARCRGVMEKCTFCIQRIRMVEYEAKRERRKIADGEIKPACLQTCPTRAFVFGDLLDEEAEVTRLTRNDPRRYHVLETLNTKPAATYLRRILADEVT